MSHTTHLNCLNYRCQHGWATAAGGGDSAGIQRSGCGRAEAAGNPGRAEGGHGGHLRGSHAQQRSRPGKSPPTHECAPFKTVDESGRPRALQEQLVQASISKSKRRGEEAAQAAEGRALESMEDVPSSSESQHLGITEDLRPAALIRKVSRTCNLHPGAHGARTR